ncbi:MAG: nucleotidyltransferase domain-containing protein [Candidatus Woesearchaeota archaeon]|nr:nucleotidyltransferase domain-containing protein [Candidatus Woesearchaeota archaeon]
MVEKMTKMFHNTTYKIFTQFMQYPTRPWSLRGLARKLKISHATVLTHIEKIHNNKLIVKRDDMLYPIFTANIEQKEYQFHKKHYIETQLKELTEYLRSTTLPNTIILFGSSSRGTDTEKSDIDIFVEAKATSLQLRKFEKKLQRKINVLFEQKFTNLPRALQTNIANGTILAGMLRIHNA